MRPPRWSALLLRWLAPRDQEDEILGDLEEAHAARVRTRGQVMGGFLTALETLDMAVALVRQRGSGPRLSLLDFKLGVRMLARYPALTGLGGLGIAFAICAGAGTFEFLTQVADPRLPFEDGDRLVAVDLWDTQRGTSQNRALFDLGVWQEELGTLEELGAFRTVSRNLIVEGSRTHLATVAVMDASGFRLTGVPPLMGRTFTQEDERPGASPVAVLGHALWTNVFEGDPSIVGRVVGVGSESVAVIGVMPEGFTFPIAHDLWLPLKVDPGQVEAGGGPSVQVFGRLAPGVTRDDAQAEITQVGLRLSTAFPESHAFVRPFVKDYTRAMLGLPSSLSDGLVSAAVMAWNIPLLLFLVLICGNVALLLFARAATRESELVVRSALGASRRRLVGQLFAEALVLASLGAVVGLGLAGSGLRWAYHVVQIELWKGPLPFWFRPELSLRTILYAVALTLTAAAVAGVLPALKATRGLGSQLRQASGGGGGHRFGGIWTFVIVSQIAVTVAFPVVAFAVATEGREIRLFDMGIPAHEYLTAALTLPAETDEEGTPEDPEAVAEAARAAMAELELKILSDPRVRSVTFAEAAPRLYNGWNQIEVDGPTAPPRDARGHRLGRVDVEPDFFATLGVEPRLGRDFQMADAEEGSDAVIVNEAFIDEVLGGRNPIGVAFRYVASERGSRREGDPGPWLRVVGVVQNLGRMSGYGDAVVYHAVPDHSLNPAYALIHVPGDAAGFAPTLRALAFEVDTNLRVGTMPTLDRMVDSTAEFYRFWVSLLAVVSVLGVILSIGGIYAVMSFTVARRTREIGIRVALGAPRTRIVLAIFRRPLTQISLGLAAGALLSAVLLGSLETTSVPSSILHAAVFVGYVACMGALCLAGCYGPTRRALGVEPSEALRIE